MSAQMHSDSCPPGVRCIAPVESDVQFMVETALIVQAAAPVLVGDVADVEELAGSSDLRLASPSSPRLNSVRWFAPSNRLRLCLVLGCALLRCQAAARWPLFAE